MGAAQRTSKAARLDGRSPVRVAVLAVVAERPGHGWDIASRADHRVGYLWTIDHRHVYSHLKWLLNMGYIRSEKERFERPPYLRDVYHVAELGIEARAAWLAEPLALGGPRIDLEVRLLFSMPADIAVMLEAVHECRGVLADEIEQNATSYAAPVSYSGAMTNLQRSSVEKRLKAEIEWLEEAQAELEGLRDRPLR